MDQHPLVLDIVIEPLGVHEFAQTSPYVKDGINLNRAELYPDLLSRLSSLERNGH